MTSQNYDDIPSGGATTHFDIGGVGSSGEVREDDLALVQVPL